MGKRGRNIWYIFEMPPLSPSMTHGAIHEWLVKPGDKIRSYDLFLKIKTRTLLASSDAQEVALLDVEVMEDELYVASLHSELHKELPVGTVIALLTDNSDDIVMAASSNTSTFVPNKDTKRALWQAYVTTKSESCGSCS